MLEGIPAEILTEWLTTAVKFAPVILVLVVVSWDLRRQLMSCIAHNQAMLDELWDERFKDRLN